MVKNTMGIYIYIHNAGISPTHVLFTRYYFIVFIINTINKELGQQYYNPGEEIEERGGERGGLNENLRRNYYNGCKKKMECLCVFAVLLG